MEGPALLCTSWHVARSQLGRSTIFGGRVFAWVDVWVSDDYPDYPPSARLDGGTDTFVTGTTDTFVTTLSECRATTMSAHPGPIPASQQLLVPSQCGTLVYSAHLSWSTSFAVPLVDHARRSCEAILSSSKGCAAPQERLTPTMQQCSKCAPPPWPLHHARARSLHMTCFAPASPTACLSHCHPVMRVDKVALLIVAGGYR